MCMPCALLSVSRSHWIDSSSQQAFEIQRLRVERTFPGVSRRWLIWVWARVYLIRKPIRILEAMAVYHRAAPCYDLTTQHPMGPDSASLLLRVKMGLSMWPSPIWRSLDPQANDQTETRSSGQDDCHDEGTHGHSHMCQSVPTSPLEQAGLRYQSHHAHRRGHITDGGGLQLAYLYAELLINKMENFIGKKISFAFNMRHSTWCLRKYVKALPEVKRIQVDPGRRNVNGFSLSINLVNNLRMEPADKWTRPSWFTCPTAADRIWFWVND